MSTLRDATLFVSGMLAAGYAVAALYFLKFWKQTGDRLFGFFAAAFGLLFLQRVALTLASDLVTDTAWYYAVRLLAFGLILVAIVDKNRGASS
jgi:membrane-associated PAP2 superfamily phosphatase